MLVGLTIIAMSSAIGAASRRYCYVLHRAQPRGANFFVCGDRQRLAPVLLFGPDEVARPCLLFPAAPERDQREPEVRAAPAIILTVRAARGAQRRGLAGLVRFETAE